MASRQPNISKSLGILPVVNEPRCNICQSVNRKHVDKLLAAGFSALSIAEEMIRIDDDFKEKKLDTVRKNVSRHADRHVNIKDRAIRQIIEKRAAEQGILVDEVEGQIATTRSLLDLMVAKGHDQMTDPDYRVRMADVIEGVKILEDVQRQEIVHQVEVMQRQVWAISTALQMQIKDQETLAKVVSMAERLFENPELVDDGLLSVQELTA